MAVEVFALGAGDTDPVVVDALVSVTFVVKSVEDSIDVVVVEFGVDDSTGTLMIEFKESEDCADVTVAGSEKDEASVVSGESGEGAADAEGVGDGESVLLSTVAGTYIT